jgi:hypothetical protein
MYAVVCVTVSATAKHQLQRNTSFAVFLLLFQQTPHLQVPYCCAVVGQHPALVINQPHVTQHVRTALARLQTQKVQTIGFRLYTVLVTRDDTLDPFHSIYLIVKQHVRPGLTRLQTYTLHAKRRFGKDHILM